MMHDSTAGMPVLVTGGCGFVGRHVVAALLRQSRHVWIIDDLSTGQAPALWTAALGLRPHEDRADLYTHPDGATLTWIKGDVRHVLHGALTGDPLLPRFSDVFHFAAVVGGRMKIDGDPLSVATDLAIDAEFFNWAVKSQPDRILYASSSAAYPVRFQGTNQSIALHEDLIDFTQDALGMPDMTYGWAKLTGEYLARFAAAQYGLKIACIRPFSGYGEDQDDSYPIPAIAARAARHEDPLIVWGTGQQGRDFVHIDDCVTAMFQALDVIHDGGAVNIGSGRLTTFLEVARLFADLAGYSPAITPLIDKPTGVQARYADTTRSACVLKWTPTISLEQGFTRVLAAVAEPARRSVPSVA